MPPPAAAGAGAIPAAGAIGAALAGIGVVGGVGAVGRVVAKGDAAGAVGGVLPPIRVAGTGLLLPKRLLAWANEGMAKAAAVRVITVAVVRREGLDIEQVSNRL